MNECVFCKIINGDIPSKKIYEDDKLIVIMDINPVVDGHLLVIPKNHVEDFTKLDKDLLLHIYDVAKELGLKEMNKLNSKGLTLTVNYGDAQEVKHFHLHLLPDYQIKKHDMSVDDVYEVLK